MSANTMHRILVSKEEQPAVACLLSELLFALDEVGYHFVPPTPASHARVVARPDRRVASDLAGVFGWSLPFDPAAVAVPLVGQLQQAGILTGLESGLLTSKLRVARLHGKLFLHSAYPTTDAQSVFLGPDSYRFADFIIANMPASRSNLLIADYGCGAGVGGIVAASSAGAETLVLADINPQALFLASVNARCAGVEARLIEVAKPSDLDNLFDVIVTHPPFMIDESGPAYRNGGGVYGAELSRDWVLGALQLLRPGGRVIMHTGAPISWGKDVLRSELEKQIPAREFSVHYRELDPDIFGDELDKADYADVDRIAAVGAVVISRHGG